MNKPRISKNFTVDDIHQIREYNHEMTKNMTFNERKKYYEDGSNLFKNKLKKSKELISK